MKKGRPNLDLNMVLNKQFRVRLSVIDMKKLSKISEKYNMGKSEVLRKLISDRYVQDGFKDSDL